MKIEAWRLSQFAADNGVKPRALCNEMLRLAAERDKCGMNRASKSELAIMAMGRMKQRCG